MFTWDHRIVRDEENLLILAEVYYNDAGEPYGYSQLPTPTSADTAEERDVRVQQITDVVRDNQPVLDVATILAGTEPETIITCVKAGAWQQHKRVKPH